jgi:predicted PhzF superfamily epimerase YddE/YHI9
MKSQPLYQVDAFAEQPFSGNPAGVMPLDEFPDDRRLQAIAAQMNLAETAFVVPRGDAFDLRWFTPTVEVDLCGHATLATAFVLWETGRLPRSQTARFHTRSGWLSAEPTADQAVSLDFPALPVSPAAPPAELLAAFDFQPTFVGFSKFDYLLEAPAAADVRAARADLSKVARLDKRGVIITARGDDPKFDCVSRFFAPAVGVDEDPATGSAHCSLGPYWSAKLGRATLRCFQASPRGGFLTVQVAGSRVHLIGRAILIWRGELMV